MINKRGCYYMSDKENKLKRELRRITINVPVPILDSIDDYAMKNGLSRTAAIAILCSNGLKLNQDYKK